MAARTPYRSAAARPEKARFLTLVDQRPFVALALFATTAVTLALVEFPRSVRVSCTPGEGSVRCAATSQVRGLGLVASRRETTVSCASDPVFQRQRNAAQPYHLASPGQRAPRRGGTGPAGGWMAESPGSAAKAH